MAYSIGTKSDDVSNLNPTLIGHTGAQSKAANRNQRNESEIRANSAEATLWSVLLWLVPINAYGWRIKRLSSWSGGWIVYCHCWPLVGTLLFGVTRCLKAISCAGALETLGSALETLCFFWNEIRPNVSLLRAESCLIFIPLFLNHMAWHTGSDIMHFLGAQWPNSAVTTFWNILLWLPFIPKSDLWSALKHSVIL